jgi:hypothetical protein
MKIPRLTTLLLTACTLALPLHADLVPEGPDFRIDEGDDRKPVFVDISMAPDSSFFVVWTYEQEYSSLSCDQGLIYARSFRKGGVPLQAHPFYVADTRLTCIESLRIGPPRAGRRPIVWTEAAGRNGNKTLVLASIGPSGTANRLREIPRTAAAEVAIPLRSGRFLVLSQSSNSRRTELRGRRYDAQGGPLGRQFVIYQGRGEYLAMDAEETAGSDIAVTWLFAPPSGQPVLLAQVFHAGGTASRGPSLVKSGVPTDLQPRVASNGTGRFAVLWSAFTPENNAVRYALRARLFAGNGKARSGVLDLDPPAPEDFRILGDVAMGDAGQLMPVWTLYDEGGIAQDVGGELVAPDDSSLDPEEPLGEWPDGQQRSPAVATDGHDFWVPVWTGDGIEGKGIYGRLFREFLDDFSRATSAGMNPRLRLLSPVREAI